MISVQQAKKQIKQNVKPLKVKTIEVADGLHHYLAEDIIAPVSIPLFNQSAMDGYAFRFEDIEKPLRIVGEVPAGSTQSVEVKQSETVRIYTGSKVPESCDTVVMQELTATQNGKLIIKGKGLKLGGNIRLKGNQITKGAIALKKGNPLNAGAIGFLSTLGIASLNVHQHPSVVIIATGSELVKVGESITAGQIYESNTVMLSNALKKMGIISAIEVVDDNKSTTSETIAKALKKYDVLLLSGGISVGNYDFVKASLEENGVEEIFYKVKQKPGKPLYVGKTTRNYVFALPGNPAAALNCFYEYVYMAINIMIGNAKIALPSIHLPIRNSYQKKTGRANFLKAITDFKTVSILDGQGSDALQAFALANCLIYLPEAITQIKKNDEVEVHLLPT